MGRKPRPCGRCPLLSAGWCTHLAKRVSSDAVSCEYGRKTMNRELMARQYQKRCMAKRRKVAKATRGLNGDAVRMLADGTRVISRGRIPGGGFRGLRARYY